jgi:hypothetical protein
VRYRQGGKAVHGQEMAVRGHFQHRPVGGLAASFLLIAPISFSIALFCQLFQG